MKQKLIIVSLFIILGLIYVWRANFLNGYLESYPDTMGSFLATGSYKINPQTILGSLDRGDTDVFQPEQVPSLEPLSVVPVGWRQADYQKIADALSQFAWNDSLEDWTLYRMDFRAGCQDAPSGLDYGEFYYYQDITVNGRKTYAVRGVSITPQYGDVDWGGDTYYPRPFFGWKSIKLNKLKVIAEAAIQEAETRGGKSIRLSVQNKCQIYISMNPDVYGTEDWVVRYGGNSELSNHTDFRIRSK